MLEFEVREGDAKWMYREGIQKFLHALERNYRGYKAPELKFARISYIYGDQKDCWLEHDDGEAEEEEEERRWRVICSWYD